jgi:hypothetical protein
MKTMKERVIKSMTQIMGGITYILIFLYFLSLFYNYYSTKGYEEIEKEGIYTAGRVTKVFNKRNSHIGFWFLTPKGKFFTSVMHPHKGYLEGCQSYNHTCIGKVIVVRYLPNEPTMNFIDTSQDTLLYIHLLDTIQ